MMFREEGHQNEVDGKQKERALRETESLPIEHG